MRARNDDDGINIQEQFASVGAKEQSMRPEMKGPSDINDLLSGLKTMSVNMPPPSGQQAQSSGQQAQQAQSNTTNVKKTGGSGSGGDAKPVVPKTPRKQKSDKNTVSLDI
jgi:hypothetical protein